MTSKNESRSATNPDQPRQADHVAEQDRISSRGADYAKDDNASAEGNDAALIAGPAFVRRVNPDGTVQAVPASSDDPAAPCGEADAGADPDTRDPN